MTRDGRVGGGGPPKVASWSTARRERRKLKGFGGALTLPASALGEKEPLLGTWQRSEPCRGEGCGGQVLGVGVCVLPMVVSSSCAHACQLSSMEGGEEEDGAER